MNEKEMRGWVGRNCKFAQAGGLAGQIAQQILATNKAPTPQQVQQAIQTFMQDSAVQLPPGVNVKTLATQIMNVIQARGGNSAPVPQPQQRPQPQQPTQKPPQRQNPFQF